MSTDYGEKEREFLATLEEDTGRSLAGWMDSISAERLADKNDVIDWLRAQGFMFWKASWLERIHSNGGRPIYTGGAAPIRPEGEPAPAPPSPVPVPAAPPSAATATAIVVAPATDPANVAALAPAPDQSAVDELLGRAKALAPLARHLLREIKRTVPTSEVILSTNALVFRAGREFAVLTIGPKELRLGLALGAAPVASPFLPARFPAPAYRVPAGMTHMIALSDARQVGPQLLESVANAAVLARQ